MEHTKVNFTEIDCKALLNKYFNGESVELVKFSLDPLSDEVNGFMGEHLCLKVHVLNKNKEESLRFFIKTLIADQDVMAEFIKTGNMFNKEIFWYKFLDEVKQECPEFDFSFAPKYYSARRNEFIVLEDLCDSGCVMLKHLNMEHVKLSLSSIAKYHAASLIFEEIKSNKLARKYRLMEDHSECLQESIYRKEENYLGYKYIQCALKALQALADLLPEKGITSLEFKHKLATLVNQAFEDIKPSAEFRNVWCNGDLWIKNVMFQYENGFPIKCKIFDFQHQRYNPPAHDVLLMIYETTTRTERQQYFEEYLNFYYRALTSELKRFGIDSEYTLSRDEFDITCKELMPAIKLTKTIYSSISQMSPETFKNVSSDPQLYARLTFEDRSQFVVDLFKTEKHYKETMTTLLEDLRDVVRHDKISIEDCYKILRQKLVLAEYDLLEYEIIPFDQKCGFLGDHSKLKIKIRQMEEIHELCFFVKSMPKEKSQRNFVLSSNLFFKEMKFYMNIVSKMIENGVACIEECVSRCYLARLNDVLVFDDYSLKGYVTQNSRTPYNYETVTVIIKKLARLHASALILEEKLSSGGQKYRIGDYYQKELYEAYYKDHEDCNAAMSAALKGTLALIDLFPDPTSKISAEIFKKRTINAFNRISKHAEPSTKYRNTVCHGDLWSNNIFIKLKNNLPIDCLFVDFQTTRYNPPAHDLVSFLYLSTDPKFRSEYMTKVLDQYHLEISQIFESHGIDPKDVLPYQEFLESCEDMKEIAVVQCVEHFHNIIQTSEQIKDLFADQEYARKILFEDRSPFIVKLCEIDPVYKQKMQECIVDLRELCENSDSLN